MSQAKQCDRCGMLYVPYSMSANNSVIIHRNCELVDLCPSCYNELKRWLDNEAEFAETVKYADMPTLQSAT